MVLKVAYTFPNDDHIMGENYSDKLPGESVEISDATVYVHPVLHGNSRKFLFRPNDDVKEYFREHTLSYLEDDTDVYTEQNLDYTFEIDDLDVTGINDQDWAKQEYPRIWGDQLARSKREHRKFMFRVITLPLTIPFFLAKECKYQLFGMDEETRQHREEMSKIGEQLTDPQAAEQYMAEMEADPASELEERDRLWEENPEKAVRVSERSRYMAEYVVERTEADEAHMLVGNSHYNGVLYWLKEYKDGVHSTIEDVPEEHMIAEGYL